MDRLLDDEEGDELSEESGGEDSQHLYSAVTVGKRQAGLLFLGPSGEGRVELSVENLFVNLTVCL